MDLVPSIRGDHGGGAEAGGEGGSEPRAAAELDDGTAGEEVGRVASEEGAEQLGLNPTCRCVWTNEEQKQANEQGREMGT